MTTTYTPRAMSRARPSVSSIIAAVTSRWVQALIRPSIMASRTPRWRSSATIFSAGDAGAFRTEENQVGFGLLHLDAGDLR